jgi:anti-sigma B factor antagonist
MFISDTGPASGASILDVRELRSGGRHTLLLEGDLDISSGPELKASITRLCEQGTERLTLDLSKLTFMDSTGLHAIISASQLCAKHGSEFSVTSAPLAVQRVFEICGLAEQAWFQDRSSPVVQNGGT